MLDAFAIMVADPQPRESGQRAIRTRRYLAFRVIGLALAVSTEKETGVVVVGPKREQS
jgi:hypothetical protein